MAILVVPTDDFVKELKRISKKRYFCINKKSK